MGCAIQGFARPLILIKNSFLTFMLDHILTQLDQISLEEMSGVKLMNRIDTKFLTTSDYLEKLLCLAKNDFFIQEINEIRNAPYYTRYYDTSDVRMFYDHQRGKKSRRKVRIREYVNSGITPFLEIKDKNNKGRTKKKRVSMENGDKIINYGDFISSHSEFNAFDLDAKIENRFDRITLVNKEKTERITIDTSLEFHNFVTHRNLSLPKLVIIEWKRDGFATNSCLKPLLRQLRIKERSFSKYIMGMALTDSDLPHNKIKNRINLLYKMIK